MSEDKVDVILNCLLESVIGTCVFDVVSSTLEKVLEKIGEGFDNCLIEW